MQHTKYKFKNMAKRQIREKTVNVERKTMGRSRGKPVVDPVLGDKVSPKIYTARRANNPKRYQNVEL